MRDLTFAVIGAGFWGAYQIAAWKEVPGARLIALCDRDRTRAATIAQKFDIPHVYADAEEMLRSESLEFIDVAAGPEAHVPLVSLAARHHISVICQKPMALDYLTCEQLVKTSQEAGVTFLVHENFRWQSPMRRVNELLSSGRIGIPFRAHIQFSHGDLSFFDNQPYLYTQPHFAMQDMGPHVTDLVRFFFGTPQSVYAREFNVNAHFHGEDIASIFLEYPKLSCHCELTWRTTGYEVFIEGTEGAITWNPNGLLTVSTAQGDSTEQIVATPYAWADPLYGFAHSSIVSANQNLLAGLKGECIAETTAEDNLKSMWLLHRALESARQNQVLQV
jgi:D-apiose dehydrogenase